MDLIKDNIVLRSTADTGYFFKLFNLTDQQRDEFIKYALEFWDVYVNGLKQGVVCHFVVNGHHGLEALADRTNGGPGFSNSVKIGRMAIGRIFSMTDKVRTCATVQDKVVNYLCKKIGFKKIGENYGMNVYEMENN